MGVYRISGYDRALLELKGMALSLAGLVREQLAAALAAMERGDERADWHERDNGIDAARDRVVDRSLEMVSLQQPRQVDLRWILGYQRIAQELERIGDYACDVAELGAHKPAQGWPPEIPAMAAQLLAFYDYAVAALDGKEEIAVDPNLQDDALDQAYLVLQRQVVMDGRAKTCTAELALALILARTLERTGDHVVNVVETLYYIRSGKRHFDPADVSPPAK